MRFCAAGSRVYGQADAMARLRAARDACGVRRRRLQGDGVDKGGSHAFENLIGCELIAHNLSYLVFDCPKKR